MMPSDVRLRLHSVRTETRGTERGVQSHEKHAGHAEGLICPESLAGRGFGKTGTAPD